MQMARHNAGQFVLASSRGVLTTEPIGCGVIELAPQSVV